MRLLSTTCFTLLESPRMRGIATPCRPPDVPGGYIIIYICKNRGLPAETMIFLHSYSAKIYIPITGVLYKCAGRRLTNFTL